MNKQGKVKWFNPTKGFGFISTSESKDVFVHISAVQAAGLNTLEENQNVSFEIQDGPKCPKAVNISII